MKLKRLDGREGVKEICFLISFNDLDFYFFIFHSIGFLFHNFIKYGINLAGRHRPAPAGCSCSATPRRPTSAWPPSVGISPPTCLRRVQRLRETGLIERQVALLSPDRLAAVLGHGLQAVVEISLDRQDAASLDASRPA
jgi:hypothetical protein